MELSLKPQLDPVHVNSADKGQNSMRSTRVERDLDEKIVMMTMMMMLKLGRQNIATS